MVDHRIHTFLTLYREMNYRRTAELLNMTQPGVTQHIQYLEKAYHTKLFQYDGKTLTFCLRIGATKTIGEFVILPAAARFAAAAGHRLELVVDNTEILLSMLDDRLLDFALIEGTFDKTKFDYHLFKKEHFVGVCGKQHRFAGRCVPIEDIFSETLIVRERGSGTRGIMEQLLRDRSFSTDCFQKVVTVNNFTAIRHFAASGLGITFAYQPIVDGDDRLASFQLEDVTVVREFNYVYLSRNIALEQIRRFEHCQ